MKRIILAVTVIMTILLTSSVFAAPLFPDVPENHWARDAVADLAAKGILEGYPDGTFKGDRATTRWELAMAMQRFLAKMEAEHSKFATKADLEALRALVNNLKDELDALGVRVTNLESNVSSLDKRVTELERITFEGDFATRYVGIGIHNTGIKGTSWDGDVGGIGGLNVDLDGNDHKFGPVDLINGRPFINGSSFTARARLGIKIKVNKDWRAGLRFASYTSLGDPYIDAYWGVSAPYLSNNFTGNTPATAQNITNSPWTKATFDKFVMENVSGKSKITIGSIEETLMDSFVVSKVPNPNVSGKNMADFEERIVLDRKKDEVVTLKYREDEETYLPFYGIQYVGDSKSKCGFKWEVLYSKMPFGSIPTAAVPIPVNDVTTPYLFSLAGKFNFANEKGTVKVDFARISENKDGSTIPNHGNYWYWTDPQEYASDTQNKRPMRSNSFISQQGQTSYGISLSYRFEPSYIRVLAAYAGSQYKPNIESGYTADGNFFRLGAGWTNEANTLSLDAEYISVDPYYDAYQLYFQPVGNLQLGGVPSGTPLGFNIVPAYFGGFPGSYIPFGYQLHDSGAYPNNRVGFRFRGHYRFPSNNGNAELRFASLTQHTATEPHRNITGNLGGTAPGFIDPIFYAQDIQNNRVVESHKGKQSQIGGTINYNFTKKFKGGIQYDYYDFNRDSNYADTTAVAKTNKVNLNYQVMKFGLTYDVSKKFSINGGYDYAAIKGYHPGVNVMINANAGADVLDLRQSSPYLGFEYNLSEAVSWDLNCRLLDTVDDTHFANYSPESYKGYQLVTGCKVRF